MTHPSKNIGALCGTMAILHHVAQKSTITRKAVMGEDNTRNDAQMTQTASCKAEAGTWTATPEHLDVAHA